MAVAAVIGLSGCADDRQAASVDTLRTTALASDELRLFNLDNQRFDLGAAGPEAVTAFIFVRSDCPISNRYAPEIRRLYETFHPRGVALYLVYVDRREQPETIRKHLAEFVYPCPALRDDEHTLVAATGVTVTPEAVVLGADRRIAYRGRIDDQNMGFGEARSAPAKRELADAIEATLEGRPVAAPITRAVGCYIIDLQ
jgi:hypothetical protein